MSGLPKGKSGVKMNFRVEDGALRLRVAMPGFMGGFDEWIPVAEITGAEIVDQERVSGMRVVLTGWLGLLWKKHDRFLMVHRLVAGIDVPVMFTARLPALDETVREIVAARAALPESTLATATESARDPIAQLERLAALKDAGHLTAEEFDAQKRALLDG